MHITNYRASDEEVSNSRQMGEFVVLQCGHVFQLDVHELVHGLENAFDLQVVFELC